METTKYDLGFVPLQAAALLAKRAPPRRPTLKAPPAETNGLLHGPRPRPRPQYPVPAGPLVDNISSYEEDVWAALAGTTAEAEAQKEEGEAMMEADKESSFGRAEAKKRKEAWEVRAAGLRRWFAGPLATKEDRERHRDWMTTRHLPRVSVS